VEEEHGRHRRAPIVFKTAKWPENLKAARAGKLQMWGVASASGGDGQGMLTRYYGPQAGNQNLARFKLPALRRDLRQADTVLPDGPERLALFDQAKKLAIAYAPYKLHVHRYVADMMHPWSSATAGRCSGTSGGTWLMRTRRCARVQRPQPQPQPRPIGPESPSA
jgi:hypothetical protein